MRNLIATVGLLLAAACSPDATNPARESLSGDWNYYAQNVSGGGISCNISGAVTLTHGGATFSGDIRSGEMTCSGTTVSTQTQSLGGKKIVNGNVKSDEISFDLSTSDVHNVGRRSRTGNSAYGTVSMRVVANGQTFVLSGEFSLNIPCQGFLCLP
jgi:hypothetical protein